jgi:glucose-1-phosphatase
MMKNSIRWIVFDLGGVVINVNFKNFFTALPNQYHMLIMQQEQVLTQIFRSYEGSSGEQLPEQVFDQIRDLLNVPVTNKQLIAAINAMLGAPMEEVCDAIEKLSKNYAIACLSNTNHIHWDYLLEHYPVMEKFQVQIASHLVGAAKPDAKIYQIAQDKLQAQAQELLFFDDKSENVDMARVLGWQSSVFSGYESLLSTCARLGIVL